MDIFKLNDKIELISEENYRTPGFVYDMKDEKLYISISADEEDFKLLKKGEILIGLAYSETEIIGFDATITSRIFAKSSIYELSNIRNFTKIQRRENIRVIFSKNLLYTDNKVLLNQDFDRYDKDEIIEVIDKYFKDAMMLDLSAGGLKLSTKGNFKVGQKLVFSIDFKGESLIIKGKIVHKELNLVPNKTIYLYGIKFIDIKEGEQEKIIRHLFVKMRKNRIN